MAVFNFRNFLGGQWYGVPTYEIVLLLFVGCGCDATIASSALHTINRQAVKRQRS